MLVMLGHRAPVTVIIQATVEGEFADLGPTDVIISAAEDGSATQPTASLYRTRPPLTALPRSLSPRVHDSREIIMWSLEDGRCLLVSPKAVPWCPTSLQVRAARDAHRIHVPAITLTTAG